MSFWMILLFVLLAAVVIVGAATAIFAILGAQRGRQAEWARNAFTVSTGAVFIAAVVFGAAWAIHALNNITITEVAATTDNYATPSAVFDGSGQVQSGAAVPIETPVPGTVIRETPAPERVTGVNYGAEYDLTSCNDYVFVMDSASVYTGPGAEFDSIGSLSAGATVKRIGYNDDWSLIDYNENYAFVSSASLIVNE